MTDPVVVAACFLAMVFGGLSATNHPVVDGFNRHVKAFGTTRRADEMEMSDFSVVVGRVFGIMLFLYGAGVAYDGIS